MQEQQLSYKKTELWLSVASLELQKVCLLQTKTLLLSG